MRGVQFGVLCCLGREGDQCGSLIVLLVVVAAAAAGTSPPSWMS